jgi:DNA-binding response OmpR family regulator
VDKIVGKVIGADHYLTKPFDPEILLSKINELLQKQKQTRLT